MQYLNGSCLQMPKALQKMMRLAGVEQPKEVAQAILMQRDSVEGLA